MNKIQGFSSNCNNTGFRGLGFIKKKKEADYNKFIFIDKHLLDYGIPEKVALVQDHEYEFTTVMLFDKHNECFYSEEMSDDAAKDAEILFKQNGVKEFVYLEDIKGAQYGKPRKKSHLSKNAIDIKLLSPKDRATVMKAIYDIEKREQAAKTYLKAPAIIRNPKYGYTMGYYSFLAETAGTDFNIDDVLNNLNISTRGSFEPKNVDKITVSPDGTLMRIQTKDNKKAALDFNNGKRTVLDYGKDEFNNGMIIIMDKNGPIIKKHQKTYESM